MARQRMRLLALVVACLSGHLLAQDTVNQTSAFVDAALPVSSIMQPNCDMPVTMKLNPATGFPDNGPPYSLFSPYGFESRLGAAINTGRGPLAGVLNHGIAWDFGVRNYVYDGNSAAWFGEMGFSYIYNNGNTLDTISTITGQFGITRFGQTVPLSGTATLGLTQLHRMAPRVGVGREWYWDSQKFQGVRYHGEFDLGGEWGYVTRKTNLTSLDLTGLQANDVILHNPAFSHLGDQIKGFYFGGSFGLVIPRSKYDITLDTRLEWGRQYFKLADNDDGLSTLKILFVAGVRW